MLLAIDVGNTSIAIGVFKKDNLVSTFSIATDKSFSAESFSKILLQKLNENSLDPSLISFSIISSVVPELRDSLLGCLKNELGHEPTEVTHATKTGMPILYDSPEEVGADRIVNAVAAYDQSGKSTIVVDFGTATTFDCVSEQGEYMGGVIAPGIKISSEALTLNASKLPTVNIEKPKNIIGKNTIESMQAGIFYGYVSMVDGMIKKISDSMKIDPYVISTGGFSKIISKESELIQHRDETLTLKGLHIIYRLNG